MRSFLKQWGFVLVIVGMLSFVAVFMWCLFFTEPEDPITDRVHTECLDGFEYYTRSFRTYYGVGVTLAPRWDQDGKPKRCPKEKQ
jgi:hypothetical protein